MDRAAIDALIHRVSSVSDWGARVRVLERTDDDTLVVEQVA